MGWRAVGGSGSEGVMPAVGGVGLERREGVTGRLGEGLVEGRWDCLNTLFAQLQKSTGSGSHGSVIYSICDTLVPMRYSSIRPGREVVKGGKQRGLQYM